MYNESSTLIFDTIIGAFPTSYLFIFIIFSVPIFYVIFNVMIGTRVRFPQLIVMMGTIFMILFMFKIIGSNDTSTLITNEPYDFESNIIYEHQIIENKMNEIENNQTYEYNESKYVLDHDIFSDDDMFEMGDI